MYMKAESAKQWEYLCLFLFFLSVLFVTPAIASQEIDVIRTIPASLYITDYTEASRTFTVTANETVNVCWFLNGKNVCTNSSVLAASYHNASAKQGTHNVTAVVDNENGSVEMEWQWIVSKKPSSSSGNGSSAVKYFQSGSSYGEDTDNILYTETQTRHVVANESTTYSFSDERNPIAEIRFISLKNAGDITTTIELLRNTPTLISAPLSDMVYKNLNIWIGKTDFSTPDNIRNVTIKFQVLKNWLTENNITESSITMNRYMDGKWVHLSTQKSGEDDNYIYFEAVTPGFSPLAITGEAANPASEEPISSAGDESENSLGNEDLSGSVEGEEVLQSSKSWINQCLLPSSLLFVLLGGTSFLFSKKGPGLVISKPGKHENVFFKESQEKIIVANSRVIFEFNNEINPVTSLSFMSLEAEGRVSARVELLRDKSGLVKENPPGIVYQNLNVWMGDTAFSNSGTIKDPVLSFRVNKTWLEEKGCDPSLIVLLRYTNDGWNLLRTLQTGEDSDYINYEATISSFSAFAIVAFTVAEEEFLLQ
jgi:PGF-pre-PGF domain-containing protein